MSHLEKTGQALILSGFCLMLTLVPLVFMPNLLPLFPPISAPIFDYTLLPKRLVLYMGLAIVTLGFLIQSGGRKHLPLVSSPLVLPLLSYAAIVALSFHQTTHPLDALVELIYQAALIGLFLLAAQTFTPQRLQPMLWTNALVGLVCALIGIAQYHNLAFVDLPTNGHPSATFGFRNFAAMYLVCALPLSALLFLNTASRVGQVLTCLSTTLMGVYLVYTRTRGAWLGLALALILVAGVLVLTPSLRSSWLQTIRSRFHRARIVLLAAGLVLFVALAPRPPQFTDTGLQRFDEKKADITSTVTSAFQQSGDRGRLDMWRNTLDLIRGHPLLGVGPGGWKRAYPPYDRGVMIRKNSAPVRPHNDYLWIASEYGLPGLAIYIWALLTAFRCLLKMQTQPEWKLAAPLLAVSLLAILIHACVSFPREQPQAALYLYLLLGVIAGASSRRRYPFFSPAVLGLLLGLNLAAASLTLRQIHFDRHYLGALLAEDGGNWPAVRSQIEGALDRGRFRPHGLVILGRALEKAGNYEAAEAAYKEVLTLTPHAWHAHNGLGVVYKKQGRFEEALSAYRNALAFFPSPLSSGKVDLHTNLAALYRAMGDTSNAEEIYLTILRAHPDNPGANNNLGNILRFRGQLDSAIASYRRAIRADATPVQAYFNLANTLFTRGQYREAHLAYRAFLDRWKGAPEYTQFARKRLEICRKRLTEVQ